MLHFVIILCSLLITNISFAKDTPSVFVTIAPQAFLIKQIAPKINVEVLISANQTPATFEPTPLQVKKLLEADLYFKIDSFFENNILNKVNKQTTKLKVINTAAAINKRFMKSHSHADEDHSHSSDHKTSDPHIWLSPPLLNVMVNNMLKALQKIYPDRASIFKENVKILSEKIIDLHKNLTKRLAPYEGQKFYIFHPSFGYFADTYKLIQIPIELEGKSPSPQQLMNLIRQMKKNKVKTIYIQPQFSNNSAKTLAQNIGAEIVMINPMVFNVLENLETIGKVMIKSFSSR